MCKKFEFFPIFFDGNSSLVQLANSFKKSLPALIWTKTLQKNILSYTKALQKKKYWIVKDYELLSEMYHSLSCCHMTLSKWPSRGLFPGIIFVWMYEIWKCMGYSSHIPIISLYFEYIFLEFNTFSSLFIWL